jgi:hypothetical protein
MLLKDLGFGPGRASVLAVSSATGVVNRNHSSVVL